MTRPSEMTAAETAAAMAEQQRLNREAAERVAADRRNAELQAQQVPPT